MRCYATENLVKEDFTLHKSSIKRCTESMKDTFLTSVLFKFSYNSNLKGSTVMQYLDDFLAFWNEIFELPNITS